ncbi:MAG: two-component regulator propeller domain-containing protein, partial [Bacteroidota bacterium]
MKALFIVIGLWMCCQAISQPTSLYFKNYGEKEGLSEITARRLLIDSRGYLWASTFDGLNRFNGYDFSVFRHDSNDSCSISNNMIFAIFEDSKGNIWAGTNQGLNKFDPNKACFTQYKHKTNGASSLSNNLVTDITEGQQGFIWISTNGGGIGKLNVNTGIYSQYASTTHQQLLEEHNSAISLEWRSDGKLLIGFSGGGLSIMDTKKESFEHIKFDYKEEKNEVFRHNVIRDIYEDVQGILWLATYKGLIRLDGDTKEYQIFLHNEDDKNSLPHNSVHDIEPANKNAFWLATFGGGLSYFDIATQTFYNFNEQQNTINLTNNSFFNVKQIGDKLWIGTDTNGLFSVSLADNQLEFLHSNLFYPDIIKKLSPSTLASGGYPELLMTYENNEIVAYNIDTKQPTSPSYLKDLNLQLSGIKKTYLLWQNKERLWVGTDKNGLYRYNVSTGELKNYTYGNHHGSLTHPHITRIILDSQGRLWVGTASGLNLYKEKSDDFKDWKTEIMRNDGLKDDHIVELFNDSRGRVWIGTEKGLYKYSEETERFESFFYSGSLHETLSDNKINCITEDEDGNLWVGTQSGISKMSYTDNGYKVNRYEPIQPLESGVINGLIYRKPYLWAATGKGIAKISITDGSMVNYGWERLE